MSREKGKPSGKRKGGPKWWWRHIWPITATSYALLIGAQCVMYLLSYIDLSRFFHGILLALASIPLVYALWYVKTRISIETQLKWNRIAFIGAGACGIWGITFFGGAFILWATGWRGPAAYVGKPLTFFFFFIVPLIVGAFIGDRLGKRWDYMVPYHLENEE